jgi:prepilin-type N-terminal cleavage/methylation domain-containing protein
MQTNIKGENGFTLIELLVAMAVTLIIAAATLGLFSYALNVNASGTQISNINGNLRSAMNLVVRDLLQAGQGYPTGGVGIPVNSTGGGGAGCQKLNRPVYTGTAQFPYGCANPTFPNLPAVVPGAGLGPNVIANPSLTWMAQPTVNSKNSDMITFIYQDNDLVTNVNPATLQPNYLQQLNAGSMVFSGTVAITGATVSDPAAVNDVFLIYGNGLYRLVEATAVAGQTVAFNTGDPLNLNQQGNCIPPNCGGSINDMPAATGVAFGATCNQALSPLPAACAYTAQRVLMISYFLDDTTVVNGQVVPRLMRQVGMNPPVSVAEVIEDMEYSYDYVTGVPPPYLNNQVDNTQAAATCTCTITDNQIRKVNIFMAARSDNVLPATNQYIRSNMAAQVDLRSLAFVDRYR